MQPSDTTRMSEPLLWLGYVPHTFTRLSSLYAELYKNMQEDPKVFALLELVDQDQPIPVLFFAVINFLVLGNTQHEFAQFYPSMNVVPKPASEAYSCFRAFCLSHMDELQSLLPAVRLQTNEVRRCANLLPAFELVSQRGGRKPLVLIEIGTSAGLNLNWNWYGYHYGSTIAGDITSTVQICFSLEGSYLPPLPEVLPSIARCQGIELFPLISTAVLIVIALLTRYCSQRFDRLKPFVFVGAVLMALGVSVIIVFPTWSALFIAAAIFGGGFGLYLGVDIALAVRVLPSDLSRGKDLGIIYTAIFFPLIVTPIIGESILNSFSNNFVLLFTVAAISSLLAAMLILPIKSVR